MPFTSPSINTCLLHQGSSASRHLLKNHFASHQVECLTLVHWLLTSSHTMHRRFFSAVNQLCLFTCAAHLSLHATSLIKTQSLRFSFAPFRSELLFTFADLLAHQNSNSGLPHSTTSLQSAHLTHSSPFYFYFTSLHRTSCTRHFYCGQQHFFDNKLIDNTFPSPKNSSSTFFRQQPLSQQQLNFYFLLSFCQAHFSTKIEVSALSGSVLARKHLLTHRLTLNRLRSGGRYLLAHQRSAFWVSRLKPSLLGKAASSLPTALLPLFQQHKSRELQP